MNPPRVEVELCRMISMLISVVKFDQIVSHTDEAGLRA